MPYNLTSQKLIKMCNIIWHHFKKKQMKVYGINILYVFISACVWIQNIFQYLSNEGNVFLFNDAFNTFYLQLYGVGHMVKYHSDSERGNPLPPHGLLFLISSKGSFICTIPQTELHIQRPLLHQLWSTSWNEK